METAGHVGSTPMQIKRNGVVVLEFEEGDKKASREAIALVHKQGKWYKILSQANGLKARTSWQKVDSIRLPNSYKDVYTAKYYYTKNGHPKVDDVYVVEMRNITGGTAFLVKDNGASTLSTWIDTQTDAETLRRIKRLLTGAKECGLMDPQGWYFNQGNDLLVFTDLHTREEPNGVFDALIVQAQTRLNSL